MLVFVICSLFVFQGCNRRKAAKIAATEPFDISTATYVGRDACVKCHAEEAALYTGSHHDHAMQLATDVSVLGDFDNASCEHHGITSRMYREGDRFMVRTEGPDGQMSDFQVKYVFGLEPLQQYMVEMPSEGQQSERGKVPRVQVLRLSWDTDKRQWFYLPPPDVPERLDPNDDLHWTGIAQRWNTMCAECHSTEYQKNFTVPESHAALVSAESSMVSGEYNSTFFEIDVSCEACHGPGSVHVELAEEWFPKWNSKKGFGLADLKSTAENQIQACAPCHSRRSVVMAGFKAGDNFYDHYSSALLTESIYYPDGQILDEDYVHGSFIQSKMYHKGIRCSDCHDPHSARLKHDGNQVCTSCHQHPAAKYDSIAHHFHKEGSEGAQCVNCHMPSSTYMEVDPRRDHSLRVPRPDISLKIGTPNACTGCHLDKGNVSADKHSSLALYQDWMLAARSGDEEVAAEIRRADEWCDVACDKWYGENRRRDEHFGLALAAAQQRQPDAEEQLVRLLRKTGFEAPALARATALQELTAIAPQRAAKEAERLINDNHPTVRSAAASALIHSEFPAQGILQLESALKDPIRSVRIEAARNLLYLPSQLYSGRAAADLRNALTELTEGLLYSNDRPGAHLTLGILAEQQGRDQAAIKHYKNSIAVGPLVTGARTNLAALLDRNLQSQSAAGGTANAAIQEEIDRLRAEELPLLQRDADLLPDNAGIQNRLGFALYNAGRIEEAAKRLALAAELDANSAQFAMAAALIYETTEQWPEALKWAQEWSKRSGDPQAITFSQQLKAKAAQATASSQSN